MAINTCKIIQYGYCSCGTKLKDHDDSSLIAHAYYRSKPPNRCPSTHEYNIPYTMTWLGLQCKYDVMHEGRHCGTRPNNYGDIFWD